MSLLNVRLLKPLLAIAALLVALAAALPSSAGPFGPAQAPHDASISEPVRLCGTNSSRSRRCNFGFSDCLASGKSGAVCEQALLVCRSCITSMVACSRQTETSCTVCQERYGVCMRPWVKLMDNS